MLGNALFEILGRAGIVTFVSLALENINVVHALII